MFLFPYGHVQIKTKLNKKAAEQLLIEHLEPRKFLYNVFRGNHKFFEGESNNGRFKINRVINHKNTFNPVLIGEFQTDSDQTIIDITMRFDHAAFATIIIAFLVVLFIYLCLPLQFFIPPNISTFFQFLVNALKIPSIIYLVVIILFNFEVSRVLDFLNDLYINK